MGLKSITPPGSEPVTTAEVKTHLRVDHALEDSLIGSLITAARQLIEHITRRQLMPATWELQLDAFPDDGDPVEVPLPPLQSVSSVKYTDPNGAEQTWDAADYQVDVVTAPGRITPAYGKSYPSTRAELNAVRVRFVAGYADAASVPEQVKAALKLIVGELYERREHGIVPPASIVKVPLNAEWLLVPYKVWGF